jgi:pyridoxine 5-phosphate synthase
MNQTKLSININKVATIRNARGGHMPDVLQFAKDCYRYGAQGITIHPRPDQRHITFKDVKDLSEVFPKPDCEYNIEGYPSKDFLKMAIEAKPNQITLVPDPPHVLTSDSGWDTIKNYDFLKEVITEIQSHQIRVSLFMDTDIRLIEKAKELNAERIEFYTGYYAETYPKDPQNAIVNYKSAAEFANEIGLGINAGHDLSLENLHYFKSHIPNLLEVSIGHALISDCLYYGLENTVSMYLRKLELTQ